MESGHSFRIHFDVDMKKFTVDWITIEFRLDAFKFMYTRNMYNSINFQIKHSKAEST